MSATYLRDTFFLNFAPESIHIDNMLFNSIEFLIFLPLVFLIHWFACKSGRSKNLFLIAASYLFYGWWNMKLLALIFLVTIAAYGAGLQ